MIQAIVTDIEGTTSSLSFVRDVLFPYSAAQLPDFVRARAGEPEVAAILADAAQTLGEPDADLERLIDQFLAWIAGDAKITPLKALQGLIWEYGYLRGDFAGHIYLDAVEGLREFKRQGLALYVYSSGSVHAQKLLFSHTEYGDLTPLFSGYFDTASGGKKETASYQRIAAAIGAPASALLFLSDIEEELDAAAAAGWQTYWLVRGLTPQPARHRQVSSFAEIRL